jgi:23S rRNA (adenine2503-C2)-methyltransferase
MQASEKEIKGDIKSLDLDELRDVFADMGEPSFRAGQVFKWLGGGVTRFDEMTNLSKALRDKLDARFYIEPPELIKKQISAKDGTAKYLWRLRDGNAVESVLMSYEHGLSICISTQVGCRQGCAFCASTLGGLVRNLTASEMLDQVMCTQRESGKRISNIVLMGIGEPLDNFDNVMKFLKLVTSPEGMGVGMRHISLSTCGITEKVDKLGDYKLQLTLSVSLHAPDDATRSRIMPINRREGIDKLMASCERYFNKTGRRISFEYALIDGVNDTPRHANELSHLLAGTGSHLNLIILNQVEERGLSPSRPENIRAFTETLKRGSVNFTLRRRLGTDIDAACGQLRRNTGRKES